ncbi:MAG TPA: substrate-binding domain-containing protein, partial [Ramlibacter sp.]
WTAGRDAALVATDDTNVSAYLVPPLTSYYSPLQEAGRCLGQLLLRRLDGEPVESLQILSRAELIERQDDRIAPDKRI